MSNGTAYLRIMRPLNALLTFAAVFSAGIIAGAGWNQVPVLLAASCAGVLVGSAGNIMNDILDIEIDRINRPERVLPAGSLSVRQAVVWCALCAFGGLGISFLISPTLFIIAAAGALAAWLYNRILQRVPLIGNLVVGGVTGLALLYGAAAVGNAGAGIIPALFACALNFGREIVKDLEDVEGDENGGIRTFPVRFGLPAGAGAAVTVLVLLVIGTIVPWLHGRYNDAYLFIVLFGVDGPLVYAILLLRRERSREGFHRISALLKGVMPMGIAAFLAGVH